MEIYLKDKLKIKTCSNIFRSGPNVFEHNAFTTKCNVKIALFCIKIAELTFIVEWIMDNKFWSRSGLKLLIICLNIWYIYVTLMYNFNTYHSLGKSMRAILDTKTALWVAS
jgi:hypothetical protein